MGQFAVILEIGNLFVEIDKCEPVGVLFYRMEIMVACFTEKTWESNS